MVINIALTLAALLSRAIGRLTLLVQLRKYFFDQSVLGLAGIIARLPALTQRLQRLQ